MKSSYCEGVVVRDKKRMLNSRTNKMASVKHTESDAPVCLR